MTSNTPTFFRSLFLTLFFVAFVAGLTYVAMYRLGNWGLLGGSAEVEMAQEYEDEPEEPSTFPFIIPMEGREVEAAELTFRFLGEDYSIVVEFDHRIYHGAVTAPRGFMLAADASEQERFDGIAAYYNKLTFDPEMDDVIDSALAQLRDIRDELGLDSDQYVELLTKFVQSIEYDENRGFVDYDSKALGDPRMPIQVLVDGTGDCDETVMLLAALLTREGFATAALFFEDEQHMALGIRSEGEGFRGTGYEFIETTGISYVSEVPNEFVGGLVLESDPVVFAFDPSEATGSSDAEGYYSAAAVAQVARIIKVRDSAEEAAAEKRAYIESTPMDAEDFERESALYAACFTALNSFRATVDNLGRDTGDFMDRADAIAWIQEYAWWE